MLSAIFFCRRTNDTGLFWRRGALPRTFVGSTVCATDEKFTTDILIVFVMKIFPEVPVECLVHPVFSSLTAADPETLFSERLQALLLEKAFDSRYTVPRLCRDLGMSASRLHRKLVGLTGQPAVRMIQNLRLHKAQHLLLSHRLMPITEVAYACGFNDPDYFTRLFVRRIGTTPSRFRTGTGGGKVGKWDYEENRQGGNLDQISIGTMLRLNGPRPDEYPTLEQWATHLCREMDAGRLDEAGLQSIRSVFTDVLSSQTLMGHIVQRPYGYNGDFEIIDKFYRQHRSSNPRFRRWDDFIQTRDAARAVRNRKDLFKQIVAQKIAEHGTAEPFTILNLASGPCRDVLEMLEENPDANIRVLCVELDYHAIAFAQQLLGKWTKRVKFVRANFFRFQTEKRFDLVWSAGLFDYFDDNAFCAGLKKTRTWVKPGGEIIIGNFSPNLVSKDFARFLGWSLYYRSKKRLLTLAERCGLPAGNIRVDAERIGVNLFLRYQDTRLA